MGGGLMKMLNGYYFCPQTWTLAQILAHMQTHQIEIIPVLTGGNGTPMVGTIERVHLEAIIADLGFDPTTVTAQQIFTNMSSKRI